MGYLGVYLKDMCLKYMVRPDLYLNLYLDETLYFAFFLLMMLLSRQVYKHQYFLKKWANSGLFYPLFSDLSNKHHHNFYNK